MNKLQSDFYEKYVGQYAKRFYQSFEKEWIFKIVEFNYGKNINMPEDMVYFKVIDDKKNTWWWDIEDCVIITNEQPIIEDERVANIADENYKGYNPFQK